MFRWRCFPVPPLNSSRIVLAVEKKSSKSLFFSVISKMERARSLWTCQWICFAWIVTCYSLLIAITQNIANVFDCLTRFRNCRYLQSFRPKTEKPADVNSRCPTKHKCRRQLFFFVLARRGMSSAIMTTTMPLVAPNNRWHALPCTWGLRQCEAQNIRNRLPVCSKQKLLGFHPIVALIHHARFFDCVCGR